MPLRIVAGQQGIQWHGSFFVRHSLALVNRELALALLATGRFDLDIEHFEPPAFGPEEDARYAPLFAAAAKQIPDAGITIRHHWPPDFTRPCAGRFVLIQPWEFGSLPRAWVEGIRRSVDEVWVPSTFVREGYVEGGVSPDRVFVVPNGVNMARFHPGAAPGDLPTRKRFRFLFVGGTISRKGIDVLLNAYTREFRADDDVSLIVKDFGSRSFYCGQDAGALISEHQAVPGVPEIVHLTADMSEDAVASLYAACDCLVHPYRGEGYGLPIAEAMACGKPVVVTGYGAALDFANESNAFLIPASVVRLPEKRIGDLETVDYPYWAEPDPNALAATLRRIYEGTEEARARGLQAARDIAARHTWDQAAAIAASRLDALDPRRLAGRQSAARAKSASGYEARKQAALERTRSADWRAAVDSIGSCLDERPDDWDLVNAKAVALYRLGDTERARAILEDATQRAPQPRDLHHNLAFLLLDSGEADEALRHALEALRFSAENADVRRTVERARAAVVHQIREARKTSRSPDSGAGRGRARPAPHRRPNRGFRSSHATDPQLLELMRRADEALSQRGSAAAVTGSSERPRLSVVMIVKDEEKYLADCLESVRGAADEIVIVDTGSTDGTRGIAEARGARIVSFEWGDDFSAARNASLEHATGDWALWIDADERLAEGQAGLLRRAIEQAEPNLGGYMVNIRNVMQTAENPEVCWHRACRLFRIDPGIRFTGRIHEQNMSAIQEAGYACALSQLTLDHLGYAADVMAERKKHERFIGMLEREVRENPDDRYRTFQLFNLANAYYTAGDMEKAIAAFQRADDNPDPNEEYTAMIYVEWATALYGTGRAEEALTVCRRAASLGIEHPGIHFARGHALLRLKQYQEAEEEFRAALRTGAEGQLAHMGDAGAHSYKAHYGLALALVGQERHDEARAECEAAAVQKPDFYSSRLLLAAELRILGRGEDARGELERILLEAPGHRQANADLAGLLYDRGAFREALPYLRRVAAENLGDGDAWFRLGRCCESLSMTAEARDAYSVAANHAPESAEIRVNLGRMQALLGGDAEAIACFAEAIRLNPDYANAYFNAGDALYRLGAYAPAIETLSAGLQREPTNAAGFFVLGNCCFQTADYDAASAAYDAALALQPIYPEALANRALALEMARPSQSPEHSTCTSSVM